MAKSEHQGLQIALILFVMVAVVLAITTFVFYRQSDERGKLKDAADKGKQDADTRANDSDSRLDYVMHILGAAPLPDAQVQQLKQAFAADPKMKTVIDNYEQHMLTYGAGLSKEELNYASILPKMLAVMRQMNQGNLLISADNTKFKEERDNVQKTEAARTNEALQKQAASDKKLEDELAKYDQDRKSLEATQQKELQTFTERLKQNEVQIALKTTENKKQEDKIKTQQGVIESQADALTKLRDEPFEVADGKIESVNQAAKIAWINLGKAEGLRRQTLFSVYDLADNGVKRTERKASIEVTRVLDEHLAEARIVFDDPANPILPGDQIFSPAWRPGRRIHFALAGVMDITGDGQSDGNLVRSLLLSSGGEIDAEMLDDGSITGPGMTSSTRYLVLGETPTDRSDPKVLAAWSKMSADAKQYGVEMISVDKMLEWVGYRSEAQTVPLGENAAGAAMRKPAERKSSTDTSEKFRERRPPQTTTSGSR